MAIKMVKYALLLAFTVIFAACASSINDELEGGRYALDSGDWNGAIAHGEAALREDPSNISAAIILADGYAGRSGFSVMRLITAIADKKTKNDVFDSVHDAMAETIHDTDDLRAAIQVLRENVEGHISISDGHFLDFAFRLGVLYAIEGYSRPSLAAQPALDGPIDVRNITSEIKDLVQEDFVLTDDLMVSSGLDADNDLLLHVRITYCVLKNASSSPSGFDLAALRDMTLCQLSPDDGAGLSAVNGDFESPKITNCSDFDYNACESAPPTEL